MTSASAARLRSQDSPRLRVGRYWLTPVLRVRQDPLRAVLGPEPGVYVCNCTEEAWYSRFGLVRRQNAGTEKKRRMFGQMAPGSQWVSMTLDVRAPGNTATWTSPAGVLHLGAGRWRGRMAQVRMGLALAWWLLAHRREYGYAYVYNFDQPQFAVVRLITWLLGKRLVVDYEDDYTTCRPSRWKNVLESAMRRMADGVVCVHEAMLAHFPRTPAVVWNTFADLRYLGSTSAGLWPGMTLLYSGRFDDIRGIDLLPDVVAALREHIGTFQLRVTGSGPLEGWVRSLALPEVVYRGFVSDAELAQEIAAADVCLILQKPDHPFSRGSFPSKIEAYAEAQKPIFGLEVADP
ncbi:MAG TPA: glycosyltransferase [Myxococcota bacterium]|nr:glycosyltransferase [Myxococcota bacterium]